MDNFEQKWFGKRVDADGVYGYQCVDLIRQYMHELFALPTGGAWGDAVNYWNNPVPQVLSKFDKIPTKAPKRGDIVVLAPTATNRYGHIGISTGNGTEILEQNGVGSGSGTGSDAIRKRQVDPSRILGVLRPKGEDVRAVTKQELLDFIGLMWGVNYTNSSAQDIDNHVKNWEGKPFDQAYYATYQDGRTLEHAKSLNVNEGDIVNTWKATGLASNPPANYVGAWNGKRWKPYIYDLIKQPEWQNAQSNYKEVGAIDGQKIYKKG